MSRGKDLFLIFAADSQIPCNNINHKIMSQTIRLQNLPFEPDKKQVIYVENSYNQEINAEIKEHYETICEIFRRYGKEFVYLPLYFSGEKLTEKVLYYAPYLTRQEASEFSLNSSVLLNHLTKNQSWRDVGPSLLYDPAIEGDIWEYKVQECKDIMLAMDALVSLFDGELTPKADRHVPKVFHEVESTVHELEDKSVRAPKKRKKHLSLWSSITCLLSEETDDYTIAAEAYTDDNELAQDLRELQMTVERLKLKGIPLVAIHDFIDSQERLSRMVITADYDILLPEYNIEVKMGPLPKALYFLFLRYPEGLVLKEICDHNKELLNIYRRLRGGDEQRLQATIDHLTDPLGNALHENITRIRMAFEEKFDEHLAQNYSVSGEKGDLYRIRLDRSLVEWKE